MATGTLVALALLVVAAFLPPLLFALRMRNAELHRREPWVGLGKAFLWGAFVATVLAFLIEMLLFPLLPGSGGAWGLVPESAVAVTLAAVVLAPVVEESVKALGVRFVRDEDPEPEDGAVYGAMIGLGFAGTETVFYIWIAAGLGGVEAAATTALVRGVATVSLHGAATALTGHGYWMARHYGRRGAFVGSLLLAMLFHGVYNAFASVSGIWSLLLATSLALFVWGYVRRRVARLDRIGGAQTAPPFP